MSSKLAFILSLPFILIILLFGVDLIMIQTIYTNLDSISETISFKISKNGINSNGDVDQTVKIFLLENLGATIAPNNNGKIEFLEGDLYAYTLSKSYQPIFLSNSAITINIERYAVIGINHS